jgi:ribosomal-protein-alanine N-acetyltransferase
VINIEEIVLDDIYEIYQIENESFKYSWSMSQINSELIREKNYNICIKENNNLLAYLFCRVEADFIEIMKIATTKLFRRKGLANLIILKLNDFCIKKEINKIFLDVNSNNFAAINFYKKNGFKTDSVRKNYYQKSKEDATLMSKKIILP